MNRLNTIKLRRQGVLTAKTKDEKWQLWKKALKRRRYSLNETLIRENMEYLGWSRNKVLSCWDEKGTEKIREKWVEERPRTKEEIESFYNNLELYIPELSSWHTIIKNEALLRTVDFLQFCIRRDFSSFLDFGSGIGSTALVFNYYGFQVTLADISDVMLNYSKRRFKKHAVKEAEFIDLKRQSPAKEKYDCAAAIEVLEHVTNPVETMDVIRFSLKKEGYIFVTTPFFEDRERPQHLIHDMEVADGFDRLGLKLKTISKDRIYRVFERVG